MAPKVLKSSGSQSSPSSQAQQAQQAQQVQQAQQAPQANSPQNSSQNGNGPKVVGPNIKGSREEYQLVMHLQSALFGAVYEAKGRSSGRDFAIKVLHKSELAKVQETSSIEFCEVPLSEIKFAEAMRGHEHVMEVEEHFEDQYCHYCVFELCKGGDLLEQLKQKPTGFEEQHAQFLIKQAALGLGFLHEKGVAMQDVSLENMLLNVNESNGRWQVKICDPGQAVTFKTEGSQEQPVNFHGLVGKSFRPPELHEQKAYLATKIDSWCLGWSTFYLLTAQPLFMSADPAQKDPDWDLFKQGKFSELFGIKNPGCSSVAIDFIFRLLQLEPEKRMSIAEACNHAWLADPKVPPMMAPKNLWSESTRRSTEVLEGTATDARRSVVQKQTEQHTSVRDLHGTGGSSLSASSGTITATSAMLPPGALAAPTAMRSGASGGVPGHDLPTWASAPIHSMMPHGAAGGPLGHPMTPSMRVRSPIRSPRQSMAGAAVQEDRRSRLHQPHRSSQRTAYGNSYVVATAHSPAPAALTQSPPLATLRGSSGRATSPLAGSAQENFLPQHPGQMLSSMHPAPGGNYYGQEAARTAGFLTTPRSTSRPRSSAVNAAADGTRGRPTWAFGGTQVSDGHKRMGSDGSSDFVPGRPARAVSPVSVQAQATIPTMARASSPGMAQMAPGFQGSPGLRVHSPPRAVYVPRASSPVEVRSPSPPGGVRSAGHGISWTPVGVSPRTVGPATGGTASMRTVSPGMLVPAHQGNSVFAWSPDPPSPHASPRAFSPPRPNALSFGRAPPMGPPMVASTQRR